MRHRRTSALVALFGHADRACHDEDTRLEIVATDISERCLERGRQGLFTQFEVQRGLPIQMLMHHFTQQDDHWRVSERIRSMVTFRKMNLMDPSYTLGKFDVIFCRNVLIYFDGPTKTEVMNRLSQSMPPDTAQPATAGRSVSSNNRVARPFSRHAAAACVNTPWLLSRHCR